MRVLRADARGPVVGVQRLRDGAVDWCWSGRALSVERREGRGGGGRKERAGKEEGGRTERSVDLDPLDTILLSISWNRHVWVVMDVEKKMQRRE